MNSEERIIHKRLSYCNICENQSDIVKQKKICRLTLRSPEFDMECPNFILARDKFLILAKRYREDVVKTDQILKNRDFYNDHEWESLEYMVSDYSVSNIQLPDKYIIGAPFFRNLLISSISFGFAFLISTITISKYQISLYLSIFFSFLIGLVLAILIYHSLRRTLSKIILDKHSIRLVGKETLEIGWNEISFLFIKNFHTKLKYGVSVARYLKINYVSEYSELFSTDDFLTYSKSSELIRWAYKYHQNYWSQIFQTKHRKSNDLVQNRLFPKKSSITKISSKNSLYQKELEFLKRNSRYSMNWHDIYWKNFHEKLWHFIATDGINEVIACAVYMPDEKNKSGNLIHISVDGMKRNKGLGKELVNEIVEYSKYKRIDKIFCSALPETVAFFSKLDFEVLDEIYDEVGLLRIKMMLAIN